MAPQEAVRKFPGFGIVYLEDGEGIRTVHTYSQAPAKIINADGSVSYTTPPPIIHELFGGGFCYQNGLPVSDIEHIKNIADPKMRDRAIKWFNGERVLSEAAKADVPPRPPEDERKHGEVVYLTSQDMEREEDPVTRKMNDRVRKAEEGAPEKDETSESKSVLSQILTGIKELGASVGILQKVQREQGAEIAELKKHPPAPKRMALSEANHAKQSAAMKARWADPAYKAKMMAKNPALKGKKGAELAAGAMAAVSAGASVEDGDGKDSPEGS